MSDISVSLSAVIAFVSLFAGIAGTWAVIRYRTQSNEESLKLLRTDLAAAKARIEEVRSKGAHDLAEFKLEVTRTFATTSALEGVERRVVTEIHSLRDMLLENLRKPATPRSRSG